MKIKLNEGPHAGQIAYKTWGDGEYFRYTPVSGDPLASFNMQEHVGAYSVEPEPVAVRAATTAGCPRCGYATCRCAQLGIGRGTAVPDQRRAIVRAAAAMCSTTSGEKEQ